MTDEVKIKGIDTSDFNVGSNILPDWWWLKAKRNDGRSGHRYVCPFLMTLEMYRGRGRGLNVSWQMEWPEWKEHGDDYSSAVVVCSPWSGRSGGYEISCEFPKWVILLEYYIHNNYRPKVLRYKVKKFWKKHIVGDTPPYGMQD